MVKIGKVLRQKKDESDSDFTKRQNAILREKGESRLDSGLNLKKASPKKRKRKIKLRRLKKGKYSSGDSIFGL